MRNSIVQGLTLLVLVVSLSCGQEGVETDSYVSNERRLYKKLTTDYLQMIRPVKNESETLHVSITFALITVDDLNEQEQSLYATGWTRQTWTDFQLAWNPDEFGGVTNLEVATHMIWTPDMTIVNSREMYGTELVVHQLATVHYTGQVVWFSLSNIVTHCYLDLTHFPYDSHMCPIKLASWGYTATKVNLSVDHEYYTVEDNVRSLQSNRRNWDLTDLTCNVEQWIEQNPVNGEYSIEFKGLSYNLFLRRISNFASHLFVAPSIILCFLTPVIFLLPPASHEKITLGVGVLISDVLLLGELIKFLPAAYLTMPLLGKYLLSNIVLTSLSLVISSIVINVWGRSRTRLNMPGLAFIRLIVLGPVAKFLCVSEDQYYDKNEYKLEDHGNSVNLPDVENIQNEPSAQSNEARSRELKLYLRKVAMSQWNQLAVVIDRFFIILYLIVITGLTLAFTQYM